MPSSPHIALFTNDVETTSIVNHRLDDNMASLLLNQGMPRLLDLYARYGVRATFFFTAHVARLQPALVRMAVQAGHEVGSHGLTHRPDKAFDVMPPDEQLLHLRQSREILEDIAGCRVVSFRAPALRVPPSIPALIQEGGYLIDSSVSPQRMDIFLSFGSRNKLRWMGCPRHAYRTAADNIFARGTNGIFEVPITALVVPYIGTALRLSPLFTRATRRLLYAETLATGRQFVFLTHPNEFVDEERDTQPIARRSNHLLAYLMGDVVRHALKVHNLGEASLPLLEHELQFFSKHQFKYHTCSDLLQQYTLNNAQ